MRRRQRVRQEAQGDMNSDLHCALNWPTARFYRGNFGATVGHLCGQITVDVTP
jgi:hypothetical protein